MKRKFFESKMIISTFSSESVVTTSAVFTGTATESDSDTYNSATNKVSISYNDFDFTF